MRIPQDVKHFIKQALQEDIGSGDVTTDSTVHRSAKGHAKIIAKQKAVVAGTPFAAEVFRQVDRRITLRVNIADGRQVKKGSVICTIKGPAASILRAERVALNILQRLTGIATLTSEFVRQVKGLHTRIVDTRKTTPGMRFMEKYAVRTGGGSNHRFGLFDAVLIKDNHIKAAGGIGNAVEKVRDLHSRMKIEVETSNMKEVKEAVLSNADIIMLDNMSLAMMKKAVEGIRKSGQDTLIEASGNVTLANVRDIALTGVDMISVGLITHSAPAADLSLKMV